MVFFVIFKDPDFLYAKKLYEKLNGINAQQVALINTDSQLAAAIQEQLDQEIYTISEDEEVQAEPVQIVKVKAEKTSQVSIINSQGILVSSISVNYEHVSMNSNHFRYTLKQTAMIST